MKKITLTLLTIALSAGIWAQTLDRSIKPKPGPAPEIKLGNSESFTLPNGLKVFVVENHKLPTIECSIQFDIKPELQGDMAGYRDMMSELLLSGTTTRSKDQLNAEIDQMGANIDVSDDQITGASLKRYSEKIFELMADIAMNTNLTQAELEKARTKELSGLETEKNQPDAMVRNVSAVVNFGTSHPFGEIANEESVKKITLERCIHYYKTYFRPNVAYMAIVGDITLAEARPLIEKYFGGWQKADVPVPTYATPGLSGAEQIGKITTVSFAPRVAAVQSVVSVTYPVNLKPGDPDIIKARVANTVLGGGSQGRLFLDLREKHAWTYGAYSSLTDNVLGGTFSATVKCRNAVSDSAIGAILDEMRRMQNDKVEESALQNSITYLSGNFAIGLEDPKRVAQFAINIERYHMPKDFYQNYLKNLSAVTSDDVMEVSRKYILPDKANIVVAGSREEVANKLLKYAADNKINYYDYAGRPIVPSEATSAPTGMTAAEVFKKYLAAMGGEKAISSIKDLKIIGGSTMQGVPLTITEMKKAPNKYKQQLDITFQGQTQSQKQVYNGKKGYQQAGPQKADVTGDDLDDLVMSADIAEDLHPDKYGIKRTLKGMEDVNGSKAYVIEAVNKKGKKTTEYYDATSFLLVKKIQGAGDKTQVSEYGDYREVPGTNGYKVPYKVTESGAGAPTITEIVNSVEVNKGIADSEFE